MHAIYNRVLQIDPHNSVEDVLRGTRVLFADEDQTTLNRLQRVANELGWDGIYVRSAHEMIETVNTLLSHEIMLDAVVAEVNYLSGPTLTGITAAREIRKAMTKVPIIFLSSFVTTSIVREEIRRVSADFVPKPFDTTDLFIRLSKMIYWYKLTMGQTYQGPDRRTQSFNQTPNTIRATDYILSTPTRIQQTLNQQENV